MIFIPNDSEKKLIQLINKHSNEDYALIRMTQTMINKNVIDANSILRDLLESHNLVKFNTLKRGGKNGISYDTLFIQDGKVEVIKIKFYTKERGNKCFSIEKLKKRMSTREINTGDLLYISTFRKPDGQLQLFIINLTHNAPKEIEIKNTIKEDEIKCLLESIKPKLKTIVQNGFHNNSKGVGKIEDKDAGDTLEHLLGIETNNKQVADLKGLIEIKTKRSCKTQVTLFNQRPRFEGTEIEKIEPNDKNRVSAFTRKYGYNSTKHSNCNALEITIGTKEAPQNSLGFYLAVDEKNKRVTLNKSNPISNKPEVVAYWLYEDIKKRLFEKHPATLWIETESRYNGEMAQFKYNNIKFTRAPQFTTFLSMIETGEITYHWRGYVSKEGNYNSRNHGNPWRIKPKAKTELFGETETIIF